MSTVHEMVAVNVVVLWLVVAGVAVTMLRRRRSGRRSTVAVPVERTPVRSSR